MIENTEIINNMTSEELAKEVARKYTAKLHEEELAKQKLDEEKIIKDEMAKEATRINLEKLREEEELRKKQNEEAQQQQEEQKPPPPKAYIKLVPGSGLVDKTLESLQFLHLPEGTDIEPYFTDVVPLNVDDGELICYQSWNEDKQCWEFDKVKQSTARLYDIDILLNDLDKKYLTRRILGMAELKDSYAISQIEAHEIEAQPLRDERRELIGIVGINNFMLMPLS